MDLNEIKNRAKDLLADLTEPRPERDDRPARDRDETLGRDRDELVAERRDEPVPSRPDTDPAAGHPDAAFAERRPAASAGQVGPGAPMDDRLDAPSGGVSVAAEPTSDRRGEPGDMRSAHEVPEQRADTGPVPTPTTDATRAEELAGDPERMVTAERAESYGARWNAVKGDFVDEPRQAVAKADALVGELLDEMGQLFAQQRRGIERDLDNDDVSTEELRVALRRYRSFFDRLLSV